jgi:hypothetical protein
LRYRHISGFKERLGWKGPRSPRSLRAILYDQYDGLYARGSQRGEIVAPTVTGGMVRAVETLEALFTLKEFLDEAEIKLVEQVLVDCAKKADAKINEQEYGEGKYPDDAECDRVIGYTDNDSPVTKAIELGNMKHAAAFECVKRELGNEFPDHISREPRYGNKPSANGPVLTNRKLGSLVPDIVLHLAQKPNKARCQRSPPRRSGRWSPFKRQAGEREEPVHAGARAWLQSGNRARTSRRNAYAWATCRVAPRITCWRWDPPRNPCRQSHSRCS